MQRAACMSISVCNVTFADGDLGLRGDPCDTVLGSTASQFLSLHESSIPVSEQCRTNPMCRVVQDLAEHIHIIGGTSMLPGFRHRLLAELRALVQTPPYAQLAGQGVCGSSFIACLSGLSVFHVKCKNHLVFGRCVLMPV